MVKLITPIGMLVTVALLAVYATYAFWTASVYKSWIYSLLGVLSLVACYGTAVLRAWSQWLVYLLTALFIGAWCYSVYAGASVVFFSFFFSSRLLVLKALAPGLALVALSCLASWIVFRHFSLVRPSER
jgi:preprotein translocase subunit SecY